MLKVGVMGATGYAGIELVQLLNSHPGVNLTFVGTESHIGQPISSVYPHLMDSLDIALQAHDIDKIVENCDAVFCALPHGHTMKFAKKLLNHHKIVIDLSADFRLKEQTVFNEWYHHPHESPDLLTQAVYGLPEGGYREAIKTAKLVANPGCYPTVCSLVALPLFKNNIIDSQHCIFDAKSGLSGAGKSLSVHSLFCEVAENFSAYQVGGKHRHIPEIEQVLSHAVGESIKIQFTPHLVPMMRGMMITAYFKLSHTIHDNDISEIYRSFYKNEPFIRLRQPNTIPQTKHVLGSNFCDIGFAQDSRTQSLVVVGVIDNLIKGAAGQAIQNMNLLYGWDEKLGLQGKNHEIH